MKTILITGAGSGLGKALSELYGESGYRVLLVGRTLEKLNAVKSSIEGKGGVAESFVCDVTQSNKVILLAQAVEARYKKLDLLINNAGIGRFGPLELILEESIDEMLNLNIKGTILMTQHLLRLTTGNIINIISTAGQRGKANEAVYCASKFAVRGFTESLQKEYQGHQPAITAVYMGGMDTPFWDKSDHIKEPSRLRSALDVARVIIEQADGRAEIIV